MKPSITLASTQTPAGGSLECISHDNDIYLYLDRQPICSTRAFEPEMALARAGCSRISSYRSPRILLAGLGLGHCLHEVLTLAPPKACIDLSEPIKALVDWHRNMLGTLYQSALQDHRLAIQTKSVAAVLKNAHQKYDAIILSSDPAVTSTASNALRACAANLNPKGVLCIKSVRENAARIKGILESCRLQVAIMPVGARPGARTRTHAIICAAHRTEFLPATSEQQQPA